MNDQIDTDELKENLKSQDTWLRLLFIVLYGAILWVTSVVLGFVVLIQFLMVLFTRGTQKNLLDFGASLAEFVRQVVAYLTFNTEEKPFPFNDWPDAGKKAAGSRKKSSAKKKTAGKSDD